jgi:hypothetical protein
MDRPYRRGLAVGLLGPLAFAAGVLYWVYRYTHKIPFPVSEPGDGQLTIGLVEPSEVSTYWQPWRQSLYGMRDKFVAMAKDLKAELESGED